jgi:hypothetical protein
MKRFLFVCFVILFSIHTHSQDFQNINQQKAFRLNGSLISSINYNESSRSIQSYQPLSYLIALNISPTVYGINIPLSLIYSEKNKDFNHPFYRFGLSPSYKWIKLNLGHRSSNYSKYTISGQKSFGAGIELTPGKFRFAFLYGSFRRDKAFKTINPNFFDQSTYSRAGYAAKIGVGSKSNFLDLVLMHIADKDDAYDSISNLHPESNVAASLISKLSLSKNLKIKAEVAASIFTRNKLAQAFETNNLPTYLQNSTDYFNINTSSSISLAKDLSIDYKLKMFSIGIEYKRIDPGYKSLGSNYIRNDYENYGFKSSIRFKKGNINANIGLLKDNLKNTKSAQTNRVVSRFSVNYNPSKKFSINANYSNFSTKQSEGRIPLNDTIRLYQVNKNMSIAPMIHFGNKKYTHSIVGNYSYADMLDKNKFAEYAIPVQTNTAFLQYSLQSIMHGFTIGSNLSYIDFKSSTIHTTNLGPTISINKSLFKKKSLLVGSFSFLWSQNNQNKGNIINIRLGYNYKISKKQLLKFHYLITKSRYDESINTSNFDATRGSLSYNYKF